MPDSADFRALVSALHQGYVSDWSSEMGSPRGATRIRRTLADPSKILVIEPDITKMLESLQGAEAAFVKLIWEASDKILGKSTAPPPGAQLYNLDDFLSRGSWKRTDVRRGLKKPDFVIAHPDPNSNDRDLGSDRLVPDVVVEFKGSAAVNGGHGYCPDDPMGAAYSNQPICYLHTCWLNRLDPQNVEDLRSTRFVWIGPDEFTDHEEGPWGPRGLVDADVTRYGRDINSALTLALEQQRRARGHWAHLGLTQVHQMLVEESNGAEVIARVMDLWCGKLGISVG